MTRTGDRHARLVHELRLASESGDPARVAALLSPGVVMVADGATGLDDDVRIVLGRVDVAQRICDVLVSHPAEISEGHVNGQPALVFTRGEVVTCVVSAAARRGRISDLWVVLDPHKLQHWNRSQIGPVPGLS